MEYSLELKNARLQATRNALAGGRLEIGTAGMGKVLASVPLSPGQVRDGVLTVAGTDTMTAQAGEAASAQIRTLDGAAAVVGLTVGLTESAADIRMPIVSLKPGVVIGVPALTFRA